MLAGADGIGGGEAGNFGGLELEQAAKSRHNACVGQPVGEGGKEAGDGVGQVQPFLNKGATPAWTRVCGRSPAVPSRKVAPQK